MDNRIVTRGILSVLEQEGELSTWVEAFLVDRKAAGLSKGTLSFYRKKLTLFINYCDSQVITKIPHLTPNVIRLYLLFLYEKGHNPGGVHACYRAVKAFLRWYEDEVDLVDWRNPIHRVKAPRVGTEPIEPVEIETVRAMVGVSGVRDRAILLFLLDTGVRAQELLGMDIEDVLMPHMGSVLVRHGKGGKHRTVFLGKKTRKALRAYLRDRRDESPALWVTDEGTRLRYGGLRAIITRRAVEAGVPVPSLHDFRRAFAINALRAGVDLISLSRLMGHTSLAVLQRYLKQIPDDLQVAHQRGSPVDNNL